MVLSIKVSDIHIDKAVVGAETELSDSPIDCGLRAMDCERDVREDNSITQLSSVSFNTAVYNISTVHFKMHH